MEKTRIVYLTQLYLARKAGPAELQEFFDLLKKGEEDDTVKEILLENWLTYTTTEKLPEQSANDMFSAVLRQAEGLQPLRGKLVRMRRWKQMAAAAAILVVLGTAAWLFLHRAPQEIAQKTIPQDIAPPARARAMLMLAGGQKIYLDSIANGASLPGHEHIIKTADGRIVYPEAGAYEETGYNTLVNPRGSAVVTVTLADGTRVWLNAATTIKYFTSMRKNRKVEIEGEAYFEVAHHAQAPFTVIAHGAEMHDLGTAFNVNAYRDEANMKLTLLEGAVEVTKGNQQRTLKPGQQAQVDDGIHVVSDASLEEVMAWKNGKFRFGEKADIQAIMRQVARWYDVEVVYRGAVSGHFGGSISRNASLSRVLEILESTGGVKCTIENKQIIVMP